MSDADDDKTFAAMGVAKTLSTVRRHPRMQTVFSKRCLNDRLCPLLRARPRS
jgi:hypothetical protein